MAIEFVHLQELSKNYRYIITINNNKLKVILLKEK